MLALPSAQAADTIGSPSIDVPEYLRIASKAVAHREHHRVSEREFARLARRPGTVILCARSRDKYPHRYDRQREANAVSTKRWFSPDLFVVIHSKDDRYARGRYDLPAH